MLEEVYSVGMFMSDNWWLLVLIWGALVAAIAFSGVWARWRNKRAKKEKEPNREREVKDDVY